MTHLNRRQLLLGTASAPLLGAALTGLASVHEQMPSFESHLRPTVHTGSERWTLSERMEHHGVPGAAVVVLRAGRVVTAKGHGTRVSGRQSAVGPQTLFSVGSVSKVATAVLALRLVALGKLDLDQPVDGWLRRWSLPPARDDDGSPISLRMLLSHTAGLSVHGFKDYEPDAALPSLLQTLQGTAPALNKPVLRIDLAGARSRYSGGGYMVVQAVIEDVMGADLNSIARAHLFTPLGMQRSRFDAAPPENTEDIAHAHDDHGRPVALPRGWQSFPELAASGLWTTAEDLALLVGTLCSSYRRPDGYLPQELAVDMMTAVSPGPFGLGPRLAGEGAARIFHHAGANDSYKAYIEGNLQTGDGLVIVTNGQGGDVLGDEIRNAVSDVCRWANDWSVQVHDVVAMHLLDAFSGSYVRRVDQAPELSGLLDTLFEHPDLQVMRTGAGLGMQGRGRARSLKPLSGNRFVVEDAYVPAGTLQVEFNRDARGEVRSLSLVAAGAVLLFDRRAG